MGVMCPCFQSRGTAPGCHDFSDTNERQGVSQFVSISCGQRGAASSGSLPPDPGTGGKSPHSVFPPPRSAGLSQGRERRGALPGDAAARRRSLGTEVTGFGTQ